MSRFIAVFAFAILFPLGQVWGLPGAPQAEQLPTIDDELIRHTLAWELIFPPAEKCSLSEIVQKAEEKQNKWREDSDLWEDKYEVDFSDYFFNSDMREWQKYFRIVFQDRPSVVALYRKYRIEGSDAVFYICVAFNGEYSIVQDAPDIIPWVPPKSAGRRGGPPGIAVVRPEEAPSFTRESPDVTMSGDELTVSFPSAGEFVFRRIPAGVFMAGSPVGELGRHILATAQDGLPYVSRLGSRQDTSAFGNARHILRYMILRENRRLVKIEKDFWLGRCEVTHGHFMAMYPDWKWPEDFKEHSDYPSTGYADWRWAMEVCGELNKACEGKLPKGYKFSLPLEMQWEWACRAGTATAFSNGTDLSIDSDGAFTSSTESIAWTTTEHGFPRTHPVGRKAPNRFGLYDMHGNAWELCYDWVRPNPPVPGILEAPPMYWDARMHILRGGNAYMPEACRSAERDSCCDWHNFFEVIGFRLALIPEELTPVEPSPFSDGEVRRNAVPPEPREGGLQVRLPDGVMLHLESIPAGEFEMGSPDGETGRTTSEYWQAVYDFAPEKAEAFSRHTGEPRRRVSIGQAFWLGRLPVTREQYAAVTGADLSLLENRLRPMTQVFWEDAISFCERLNVLCRDQLPDGYRFAIPTEEQWEYACRAGTTTALNSGKDLTQGEFFCPNLAEVAWFQMNSGERKRDAGLLRPNAWGLYDMHGNVWEWCVCTEPADDGPLSGRILRGGSWYDPPRFCRSAMRRWLDEDRGAPDIGFRVALVPAEPAAPKNGEAQR